jgi:hypothetical protein
MHHRKLLRKLALSTISTTSENGLAIAVALTAVKSINAMDFVA